MIGKKPGEKKTFWKGGSTMRYSINNISQMDQNLMSSNHHDMVSKSMALSIKSPNASSFVKQGDQFVSINSPSAGDYANF